MGLPEPRPHTDAVRDALAAAGLTVEVVDRGGTPPPVVVVHPLPGGSRDGTVADPFDDGDIPYQLTCVGTGREQAEWLVPQALAALRPTVAVTGRRVRVVPEGHAHVVIDRDVDPPVWTAMQRVELQSVPD